MGLSSTSTSCKIGPRASPNRLHASSDCQTSTTRNPAGCLLTHAQEDLRPANRTETPAGPCHRSICALFPTDIGLPARWFLERAQHSVIMRRHRGVLAENNGCGARFVAMCRSLGWLAE